MIYIDRHLTWKKHINIICSKISKATFVINRVKHFVTTLCTKISILYINSQSYDIIMVFKHGVIQLASQN